MQLIIKNLSKKFRKIIPTALLAICTLGVYGFSFSGDSLRFEVLLNSKMLADVHISEPFINSLALTSNRLMLLSTSDQLYLLGWGGIVPLGKKVTGNIHSYAYTSDSLLMIVRNNELCVFDSLGNFSRLFKLPSEGMEICAGKFVMYLFDHNEDQAKYALYVIAPGGKYTKLLEVPAPILSVVEMNDSILFSTKNALFSFNLKNKKIKALAALPKDKQIRSIAVDVSTNRIYFSANNSVYVLNDSSAVIITEEFGGVLRFFNKGLIVFNPEEKLLIRLAGIGTKR